VSVVRCVLSGRGVFATGRSLVQRSPTDCGGFECDLEASIMRRRWPTGGCCATEYIHIYIYIYTHTHIHTRTQTQYTNFSLQRAK